MVSRVVLSSWLFRAARLSIIALMICLVVVAGRWGVADYYADQAYQTMRSWTRGQDASLESIEGAVQMMNRALELDPANPTYLHRMGRLHHIRMLVDPRNAPGLGVQAAAYMRQSLEVRPLWPLTWSGLALIKRDLGEFDDEMAQAIANASRFGRWEPGVQEQMAALVSSWSDLSRVEREAVLGNIDRGLRSPVRGAPQAIMRTLRGIVPGLASDLIQELGPVLAESDWPDVALMPKTELVLWLWPQWEGGVRQRLTERIVDAAVRDKSDRVLDRIGKDQLLASFCPYFPAESRFRDRCAGSRPR